MGCTLGGVGVHHGLAVEPGLFQLLEGRPLLGQGAAARGKPGFEPGQVGDAPVVRIRMGSRGLGQGGFCAFPSGAQAGDAGRALAAGFVQGGKAGAGLLALTLVKLLLIDLSNSGGVTRILTFIAGPFMIIVPCSRSIWKKVIVLLS